MATGRSFDPRNEPGAERSPRGLRCSSRMSRRCRGSSRIPEPKAARSSIGSPAVINMKLITTIHSSSCHKFHYKGWIAAVARSCWRSRFGVAERPGWRKPGRWIPPSLRKPILAIGMGLGRADQWQHPGRRRVLHQPRRCTQLRLSPESDGTLDKQFVPGLEPYAEARALALQPDRRILVGGDFYDPATPAGEASCDCIPMERGIPI